MGVYDTYGADSAQLKVSNDGMLSLRHFVNGDIVPLDDGIYVADPQNVLVVFAGRLLANYHAVYDKWGSLIDFETWLNDHNPIMQAVAQMTNAKKESRWKRLRAEIAALIIAIIIIVIVIIAIYIWPFGPL